MKCLYDNLCCLLFENFTLSFHFNVYRESENMSFACFVHVYKKLLKTSTNAEIASLLASMRDSFGATVDDMRMWLCLLVALSQKRRISDKHLLTIFCKIETPHIDRENLAHSFKKYGVAESCAKVIKNEGSCTLSVTDAYFFFEKLKVIPTKSAILLAHFKTVIPKCDKETVKDLVTFIRDSGRNRRVLCKKRNIQLFRQVLGKKNMRVLNGGENEVLSAGRPVEPMLALPCKNFEDVSFTEACVEIKYDGERVQIHKQANGRIVCYKRNLNVYSKCTSELLPYLEDALRNVKSVIVDGELMDDCAGIIVFDIMLHNDKSLLKVDLRTRKQILKEALISNDKIVTIEHHECDAREHTVNLIQRYLSVDVEGVLVKDLNGSYESKKKKWLKVKKSYFENVCSADLVVVGGWKPSNEKRIVIYLVASPYYDYDANMWRFVPVSKVKIAKHNLEHLMVPVKECVSLEWLVTDKKLPNMVAADPHRMPVWELQGDFIRSEDNKVSIRLPRFIKVRDDKDYRSATRPFELKIMASIVSKPQLLDDQILIDYFLKDNLKQKVS